MEADRRGVRLKSHRVIMMCRMTASPDVTIVIPTRDRWAQCTQAVNQAMAQRGVKVEVVVVDDGSCSEPPRSIQRAGIRVVRNDRSQGLAATRNRGLAAARADWIAFLDDDDFWSPYKLRTQLDAATTVDAGWCYGAAVALDVSTGHVGPFTRAPSPNSILTALLQRNVVQAGSSNVLARGDVLSDLNGFDTRFDQLADWDLWIRLALLAPATSCDEVLVAFALHEGNLVIQDPYGALAEFDRLRKKHADAAAQAGVIFDEVAVRRWIAFGQRRAGHRWRAARIYASGAAHSRRPGELLRAFGALLGQRSIAAVRGPRPLPGDVLDWLEHATDRFVEG